MNVEGFKNLLMQGITSPRSSGPPPPNAPASSNPLSPAIFESSSSTDTSSISRQSIFDTAQEPHPESPRTPYDMATSDDEHAGLMGVEAPRGKEEATTCAEISSRFEARKGEGTADGVI